MYGFTWSVTWEKFAFAFCLFFLLIGYKYRLKSLRHHITFMVIGALGMLSIFGWVVVQRFALADHSAIPERSVAYWAVFGVHILFGIIVIPLLALQGASGTAKAFGGQQSRIGRIHRPNGRAILTCSFISLLASIPM